MSIVSGLSDNRFRNVSVETYGVGRIVLEPAVTPDGRTLLLSTSMGPVDDSPPAEVSNHSLEGGVVSAALSSVFGPVHTTYIWQDSNMMAFPPGLADYVNAFTADLAPEVGAGLHARLDAAIGLANQGLDGDARAALDGFRSEVDGLRLARAISEQQAYVLDTLAQVGQRRLE